MSIVEIFRKPVKSAKPGYKYMCIVLLGLLLSAVYL